MMKLKKLARDLNAFTFQFQDHLLEEIRTSYYRELESFLRDPRHQYLFKGGRTFKQPIGKSPSEYYLFSYNDYPLLWFSANTPQTFQIYQRFFEGLSIEEDVKELVDYHKKIIMYCGFLVIGNQAPKHLWHFDYRVGANAYTLITPLF